MLCGELLRPAHPWHWPPLTSVSHAWKMIFRSLVDELFFIFRFDSNRIGLVWFGLVVGGVESPDWGMAWCRSLIWRRVCITCLAMVVFWWRLLLPLHAAPRSLEAAAARGIKKRRYRGREGGYRGVKWRGTKRQTGLGHRQKCSKSCICADNKPEGWRIIDTVEPPRFSYFIILLSGFSL